MHDFRKLPLLVFGLFACAAAHADDYRFELGANFDHVSFDNDAPDVDILSVAGTFYLKPVPTDGVPLAEAAFLNRSSFVNAGVSRVDVDGDHADVFGANFGYYIPNTIFYGRIGVLKFDDAFGFDDDTTVNGTFGVAPFDGLLITTEFDEDGWNPNATARYVGKFDNGHFYAASINVVDPDDENVEVGANFDYFFDPTFSVGGGLSSDRLEVRAEKFFMPNFSVGGRVYTDDDSDGDGLAAFVKWRF